MLVAIRFSRTGGARVHLHEREKRQSTVGRALCAATVLCALYVGASAQADSVRDRLARVRAEIEQRKERAQRYEASADRSFESSKTFEVQLGAIQRQLRQDEQLTSARGQLARAEGNLEEARVRLADRLVAIYKFGATGGMPALYSARDFQTVIRLGEDLARIVQGDLRVFARVREAGDVRDATAEQVRNLGGALARREIEVQAELAQRRDEVASGRSRAERERQVVERLEQTALALEQLAARPNPRISEPGPGLERGRVPLPVDGPIRTRFGNDLDDEFTFRLQRVGIEIEAERGTTVRSVGKGRVIYAGAIARYSGVVIVDHGRGVVSTTAYLENITVSAGDVLQLGDVIGEVGSERAEAEPPRVYFALSRDGQLIDPAPWFE
jgi:septal ring factor EnvC (AmiA/AmiB activator)